MAKTDTLRDQTHTLLLDAKRQNHGNPDLVRTLLTAVGFAKFTEVPDDDMHVLAALARHHIARGKAYILAGYVVRMTNLKLERLELRDAVNTLKADIKVHKDVTGINFKQVEGLAQARVNEHEAAIYGNSLSAAEDRSDAVWLYEKVYGMKSAEATS